MNADKHVDFIYVRSTRLKYLNDHHLYLVTGAWSFDYQALKDKLVDISADITNLTGSKVVICHPESPMGLELEEESR